MKNITSRKIPVSHAFIIFTGVILFSFNTVAQSKPVKGSPDYFNGNALVNSLVQMPFHLTPCIGMAQHMKAVLHN
jgi:hypothetical protein